VSKDPLVAKIAMRAVCTATTAALLLGSVCSFVPAPAARSPRLHEGQRDGALEGDLRYRLARDYIHVHTDGQKYRPQGQEREEQEKAQAAEEGVHEPAAAAVQALPDSPL
jgi:hypothetical protein